MKNVRDFVLIFIAIAFTICTMKTCQHYNIGKNTEPVVVIDTCIVYDTIRYIQPIPKDSVVIRYVTEKLPVAQRADTVIMTVRDSVLVEIPITQKEYKDSCYHAFVSGYRPQLDSIFIFNQKETITITNHTINKNKKWGIGIQAGYGTYVNNGVVRGTPYIGIGISYNIFSW